MQVIFTEEEQKALTDFILESVKNHQTYLRTEHPDTAKLEAHDVFFSLLGNSKTAYLAPVDIESRLVKPLIDLIAKYVDTAKEFNRLERMLDQAIDNLPVTSADKVEIGAEVNQLCADSTP